MNNQYFYAVWRRKTASAQVRLFEGKWECKINGKDASGYITRTDLFDVAFMPIKLCSLKDKVYFDIKVAWSGISAQVQAMSFWISKALTLKDETLRKTLKDAWLITRDPRKVERKKPGKKKARKSPSWSKR